MHLWETDQINRGWAVHQTEQSMHEFQNNAMMGPIDQTLQAIKILWWNKKANKNFIQILFSAKIGKKIILKKSKKIRYLKQ